MTKKSLYVVVSLAAAGIGLAWVLGGLRPGPGGQTGGAPSVPRRIICAAPSVTEIVFALGRGDRVVGVTDYCTYPPEALKTKERIGGLYNPNRERILKLRPDLIVFVGVFEALSALGKEHGIRTLSVKMGTLDEIRAAARTIGEKLGCSGRAEEMVRRFDADLDAVRSRVESLPAKRVYLCTAHKPADLTKLGTCGPGGFLAELLVVAGGTNIFPDAQGAWPQISKEALLKRAPEVIVELHPRGMGADVSTFEALRRDWKSMPELPAVRNGEIHFLTEDFLFIPSVRAPLIAERLARAIHPGAAHE